MEKANKIYFIFYLSLQYLTALT